MIDEEGCGLVIASLWSVMKTNKRWYFIMNGERITHHNIHTLFGGRLEGVIVQWMDEDKGLFLFVDGNCIERVYF